MSEGIATDRRAWMVRQFVAYLRGAAGPFAVFRTGNDAYYLFSQLDPTGTWATGLQFPVAKARLRDDVRRALARGMGNA